MSIVDPLPWYIQISLGFLGGVVGYLGNNIRFFSDRPDYIIEWLFGDRRVLFLTIFLAIFSGFIGGFLCAAYTLYGQDLNLPLAFNIGLTGPFIVASGVNKTSPIEPGNENRK